jgi:hypothetical protein
MPTVLEACGGKINKASAQESGLPLHETVLTPLMPKINTTSLPLHELLPAQFMCKSLPAQPSTMVEPAQDCSPIQFTVKDAPTGPEMVERPEQESGEIQSTTQSKPSELHSIKPSLQASLAPSQVILQAPGSTF